MVLLIYTIIKGRHFQKIREFSDSYIEIFDKSCFSWNLAFKSQMTMKKCFFFISCNILFKKIYHCIKKFFFKHSSVHHSLKIFLEAENYVSERNTHIFVYNIKHQKKSYLPKSIHSLCFSVTVPRDICPWNACSFTCFLISNYFHFLPWRNMISHGSWIKIFILIGYLRS